MSANPKLLVYRAHQWYCYVVLLNTPRHVVLPSLANGWYHSDDVTVLKKTLELVETLIAAYTISQTVSAVTLV